MVIDEGIYRGTNVVFGIVDKTDGEMFLGIKFIAKDWDILFDMLTDKGIRLELGIPEEDQGFAIHREDKEIDRVFRFQLQTPRSKFDYLRLAFLNIDKLYDIIKDKVEAKRIEELKKAAMEAKAKEAEKISKDKESLKVPDPEPATESPEVAPASEK